MKKKITITGVALLFLLIFVVPQICIGAEYDITKGTNLEFDADGDYPALVQIDATHYLCAYNNPSGTSGNGYAVVLTVNTGTGIITKGTACEFESGGMALDFALSQIDGTHYLCVYQGPGGDGYAVVLTVNTGDWTITKGTAFEYDTSNGKEPALAQIDGTHYLCAYQGGSGQYAYAVVLTINTGDWTISKGTARDLGHGVPTGFALSQIDGTHYLCTFVGDMGFNKGYAVVLIVNTGTWAITTGTEFQFGPNYCNSTALSKIDATHYLCAYEDERGSFGGVSMVVLVVNTGTWAITKETVYNYDGTTGNNPDLSKIDDTHYLCALKYTDADGYAMVVTVNTVAWTITAGTAFEFDTADCAFPALCEIDDAGHYLCAYKGPDADGWSVILNVELPAVYTVTVSGVSIAPSGASPGDTEVGMLKLSMVTDDGEATWTDVKVDLTGTGAVDGDISSVEVWKDDGDGTWEGTGQDTEIGSGTFSTGTVTIDITDQTINTVSQDFFIVYDIAVVADPSHEAGAKLLNSTYITVAGSNEVSSSGFPIESDFTTLPVELSTFTAQFLYGVPTLYWRTESETDNLGWNIYRNTIENFSSSTKVSVLIDGYGTTTEPHSYIYEDTIEDAITGDTYWYWLESIDFGGEVHHYNRVANITIPEGSENPNHLEPPIVYNIQNEPNPFRPNISGKTIISFTLSESALAEVSIYTIRGEFVKTLPVILAIADEKAKVFWNGKDENGDEQPTGIYLYGLKVNGKVNDIKRLILIR